VAAALGKKVLTRLRGGSLGVTSQTEIPWGPDRQSYVMSDSAGSVHRRAANDRAFPVLNNSKQI
jgi:hypothetical protein